MRQRAHRIAIALSVALSALCLLTVSAAFASPQRSPPPPDAEDDIVLDFLTHPGVSINITSTAFMNREDVTLGEWVPISTGTTDFYQGTVTQSLNSEIVETGAWLSPVFEHGERFAAVSVWPDSNFPGGWSVIGWWGSDLAAGLDLLQAADKLFLCEMTDCAFAVRAERAIPLDEYTEIRFPNPVSLADFQQYALHYHDGCEEGETCGEAVDQPNSARAGAPTLLFAVPAALIAVGLVAVVVVRRIGGTRAASSV